MGLSIIQCMFGIKIMEDNSMKVVIYPSTRRNKKFMAVSDEFPTVHFGAVGYDDYTTHNDPERKRRYIMRHKKNEDWFDASTAGFWSRWLLWEYPDINIAVKKINSEFPNLEVKIVTT